MTLFERVEQFLYTHPVQHHQKKLVEMVREQEEVYLRRIAELENDLKIHRNQVSLEGEFDRMVAEGGNNDAKAPELAGTRYYDTG